MPKKVTKPVKTKATKAVKKAVKPKKATKIAKKTVVNKPAPKKITRVGEDTPQVTSTAAFMNTGQRVELWAYDEYNQGSIIASGTDLNLIVKRAKQFATETNVDNALAAGEKNNSWEAYFPQFFKGANVDTKTLYAGNKRNGTHQIYSLTDGKWVQSSLPSGLKVRCYLGETNNGRAKSDWFLADHLKREITSLDSQALERKTVLFIKIV